MSRPSLDNVDFDAIYEGERLFAGVEFVPWDIGEAQPLLMEVEESGRIGGEVLDVGCGLGENTLFLASRGYRVTGVDASSPAIEQAREKAEARGLDAGFAVADATKLEGFEERFDTVIDSALYHCFTEEQQRAYAAALYRACRPGATLHLFCFSDEIAFPVPSPVSEQNLRETFDAPWTITDLTKATYTTAFTSELLRLAGQTLTADELDPTAALAAATPDPQGRLKMPVWHLTATRES